LAPALPGRAEATALAPKAPASMPTRLAAPATLSVGFYGLAGSGFLATKLIHISSKILYLFT